MVLSVRRTSTSGRRASRRRSGLKACRRSPDSPRRRRRRYNRCRDRRRSRRRWACKGRPGSDPPPLDAQLHSGAGGHAVSSAQGLVQTEWVASVSTQSIEAQSPFLVQGAPKIAVPGGITLPVLPGAARPARAAGPARAAVPVVVAAPPPWPPVVDALPVPVSPPPPQPVSEIKSPIVETAIFVRKEASGGRVSVGTADSPAWQSAVTLQHPVTQRPAEQHSPDLQSADVAQQATVEQRWVDGLQHSPTLQSAVVAQQSVAQRPAEQHSPCLQSFAVAQQTPAEQSLVPGSQHSPALQSAFEAQPQAPQSPSLQHSPTLQSAAAAQQGSHLWPWQHSPAWQSAAVQHSPTTQRGGACPVPVLLAVTLVTPEPLVAALVVAPPAPVVAPPLVAPGTVRRTRGRRPTPGRARRGSAAAIRGAPARTRWGGSSESRKSGVRGGLPRRGGGEPSPANRASAGFSWRGRAGCPRRSRAPSGIPRFTPGRTRTEIEVTPIVIRLTIS